MLLDYNEILNNREYFWNKAINLAKLKKSWFLVPEFMWVWSDLIKDIYENKLVLDKLVKEILWLKYEYYAIRSSSFSEDSEKSSMAWQFCSKIKVWKNDLKKSVEEVLTKSLEKVNFDFSKFSLIIQEYIESDYFWVIFTKSPSWTREGILEYSKTMWEKLVWWNIIPKKIKFYFNSKKYIFLDKKTSLKLNIFLGVEKLFNFPQDIEFCVKNNKIYFLQSRNITTINNYENILFLEEKVFSLWDNNFFYKKNEISEIAPRPTDFILNLLEEIYKQGWIVDEVYKKYNIKYSDTKFLKIIWNELFVDSEKELKSLLPSFSILNKDYKAKLKFNSNILTTFKNLFLLSKIKTTKDFKLEIEKTLLKDIEDKTLKELIKIFLDDYKLVFEINLFASKYLKDLENVLKIDKWNITEILEYDISKFWGENNISFDDITIDIVWNKFDLYDESKFSYIFKNKVKSIDYSWWENLSKTKKQVYKDKIVNALSFQKYRELARIIMLKNLTGTRKKLKFLAQKNNFKNEKNIYFLNLEELFLNKIDEKILQSRRKNYEEYKNYSVPNKISYYFYENEKEVYFISWKNISWYLTNEENLIKTPWKNQVLLVDNLSPDLVEYFPYISGIITSNWWFLSHLSIIARERWIPILFYSNTGKLKKWEYFKY